MSGFVVNSEGKPRYVIELKPAAPQIRAELAERAMWDCQWQAYEQSGMNSLNGDGKDTVGLYDPAAGNFISQELEQRRQ